MSYKETPQSPYCSVNVHCEVPALQQLIERLLSLWGIAPELAGKDHLDLHLSPEKQRFDLLPPGGPEEPLPLPVRVAELWLALQPHLFDPPRQHFRVPLRIRGRLHQADVGEPFLSVSLSDAGLRFEFPRKLPRDSEVRLDIPLGDKNVTLLGKVIYSVPTRASDNLITGVAFTSQQDQTRSLVREYLVEQTLRQAARQMDQQQFLAALTFLDLPDYTRSRLQPEN